MKFITYDFLPDEAYYIREEVFIKEQGFENELDDIDKIATHIVLFDDDERPIATCRIFKDDNDDNDSVYILGRLAVLKENRGKNIGAEILLYAEKIVKSLGGSVLTLHSQYRAKGFYEKLGYTEYGEIGYDEGCPHIWMKKSI